jgi:PPOX class probable F420-dependent enzyme
MTDQPSGNRGQTVTLPRDRGLPLPDHIRTFLDDLRFATISTIDPDGTPRQAVVWYTLDGDEIVINSAIGRRWPANLVRDPRMSLSVTDAVDGYRWVGLRGTVEPIMDRDQTQADIAAMARHYHADEPGEAERLISERFGRQDRISFRLRAWSIFDHLDS